MLELGKKNPRVSIFKILLFLLKIDQWSITSPIAVIFQAKQTPVISKAVGTRGHLGPARKKTNNSLLFSSTRFCHVIIVEKIKLINEKVSFSLQENINCKKYAATVISELYKNINEGRETTRGVQLCIFSVPITRAGLDFAKWHLSLTAAVIRRLPGATNTFQQQEAISHGSVQAFHDISSSGESSKAFP